MANTHNGTDSANSINKSTSLDDWIIYALGGNDTVTGGAGKDTIIGGAGNDILNGGAGNDVLQGGTGNDTIDGGAGIDLIDFSDAVGAVGINFTLVQSSSLTTFIAPTSTGLGTDKYKNIEGVIGTNFNDTLTGSSKNDTIYGGAGNDVISGGSGDDSIIGGAGADRLTGGSGRDVFAYLAAPDAPVGEVITDFNQGFDRIDLSALLGLDSLIWGGGTLANVLNGLWYNRIGTSTYLYADTTSDGLADFSVELQNQSFNAPEITDFIGVERAPASTVSTNHPDYFPSATAIIQTSGFAAGSTVEFQVRHVTSDGRDHTYGTDDDVFGPNTGGGHEPWYVTDGVKLVFDGADGLPGTEDDIVVGDLDGVADGNITTKWFVNPDDSLGERFLLTAKGIANNGADGVLGTADDLYSGQLATATFTDKLDPPGKLDQLYQWANIQNNQGQEGEWITGNAGGPKAQLYVGEVQSYWADFSKLLPNTYYTAVIEWDTTHLGKHAIDYITSWDFVYADVGGVFRYEPATDNPAIAAGINTLLFPELTSLIDDADILAFFASALDEQGQTAVDVGFAGPLVQNDGHFSIWGGQIVALSDYTLTGDYAHNSSTSISVTFLTSSSGDFKGDLVLAWGGHIASELENWPAGTDASAINGSPYHMRISSVYVEQGELGGQEIPADWGTPDVGDVEINGTGNRDRSLSADSVLGRVEISGDLAVVVHDESAGLQTLADGNQSTATEDDNDNDVSVDSLPTAFSARLTGLGAGTPIGAAHGGTVTFNGEQSSVFLSNIAGLELEGEDSGLVKTGGNKIFLYTDWPDLISNPNGNDNIVLGREGWDDDTANPDGQIVFALFLNVADEASSTSGDLWLTQYAAIVHPTPGEFDEPISEGVGVGGGKIHFTVENGISSATSVNSLTLTFEDDGPVIGSPVADAVDEEGLATAATQDDPYPGDLAGIALTASGSLDIAWGADDADDTTGADDALTANRSVSFDASQPGLAGLTSNGNAVSTVILTDGTLVGYTGAVPDETTDAGVVFHATLNDDGTGSYSFTLVDNLDHPTANTEDNLTLTFAFTAKDSDGDTASDTFNVVVDDDAPVIGTPEDEAVDEDDLATALATGNSDVVDASDDLDDGSPTSVTGDLDISWGADDADQADSGGDQDTPGALPGDRSVTFTDTATPGNNVTVADDYGNDDIALSSNGDTVFYELNADKTLLTAKATDSGLVTRTVFTVELFDDSIGSYNFTLFDNLDHNETDGADTEDNLTLTFDFTAKDSDGDTADDTFTVDVDDDIPLISVDDAAVHREVNALVTGNYNFQVGADDATFDASFGPNALTWTNIGSGFTFQLKSGTDHTYEATFVEDSITKTFFEIEIKSDGTYDFKLVTPAPTITIPSGPLLSGITGGSGLTSFTFPPSTFGGAFALVLTATEEDGNDPGTERDPATLTISSTELGINGNTIHENKDEVLRMDVQQQPGFENITLSSLSIQIANTGSVSATDEFQIITVYTNASPVTSTQALGVDFVLNFAIDPTKTVDYVEFRIVTNNVVAKVEGVSLAYTETVNPADNLLEFNLTGKDADGDAASDAFTVNLMAGTTGDDTIITTSAAEQVSGGLGNDTINAAGGNDTLIGGTGSDSLTGGSGNDNFQWNTTGEFGDVVTDYTPGSDKLVFDVGSTGTQIGVGNDDTSVNNYFEGTLLSANVAGQEVVVITDDGILDPLALINGGSFSNITEGTIFAIEDSDLGVSGTAVVYYDADPSVAGGAVAVAELTNITDITAATFDSTDFLFV